jgi:hypothetical protein
MFDPDVGQTPYLMLAYHAGSLGSMEPDWRRAYQPIPRTASRCSWELALFYLVVICLSDSGTLSAVGSTSRNPNPRRVGVLSH